MKKSGNGESEEGNAVSTSKKTRRSVGRSFSWRLSKKTKMEEVDKGQSFDNSEDDVDAESFEKREGTNEISIDEDEMSDLDQTGYISKKRKRFGMWKAMKRIFTRKSGKGSKSFTAGESSSSTMHPQRSISDPNLMRRTDPPELAPLEQVSEPSRHTEAVTTSYAPRKALSHDSLILELRSRRGISIENEKEEETSPCGQMKPTIIVSRETQGINWTVAPSSDPDRFVPGLNVSHDKIRVAPRHRRAPTRRGVASTRRHDNVIQRSYSVGVSSPSSLLKKQQETVNFDDLIQSLRSHQEENTTDENIKENIEVNMEEESGSEQGNASEEVEINESVSDENEIHVSTDIQDPGLNEQQENTKEDETLTMEITCTSPVLVVATPEVKIENCEEKEQQSLEEAEKEHKYSDHGSLPVSTSVASTDYDDTNNLVDTPVSLSETVSTPVTESRHEIGDSVDANISPVTTVESVSVADDKPTFEEAPKAHIVELTEPDPEPVSESISETVSEESVEAVPNNPKAATEILHCSVSEPVPLDLPALGKANAPVIPKVDSEQKTNRSNSSKEYSEQSSTINEKSMESTSVEATVTSPVRSRRLNIETPEKVFQKPIMPKVVINENADKDQPQPNGIQQKRPQSLYVQKSTYAQDEKDSSKGDSSAGVAKLTQAFERANTISYGERMKPDILPKPKILSQKPAETVQTSNDMKTKSLGRNFRISASTKKSNEKPLKACALGQMEEQIIINANDDTVAIIDQDVLDRNKINEKSEVAVKSPPKKPERRGSAPKPAPKPKLYKESKPASKTNNDTAALNYEGKENIEGDTVPKPIRNGNTKRSEKESLNNKMNIADEKKDGQSEVVMPSFWARRSRFSSDSSSDKPPGSLEKSSNKEVAKTPPFIQLKTDMCAVCGSKVYQMEKFKVKDNIIHKRCIKCYACKRLLSVGNFIMSQDKIYCKLHEPSHTVALST